MISTALNGHNEARSSKNIIFKNYTLNSTVPEKRLITQKKIKCRKIGTVVEARVAKISWKGGEKNI